MSEPLSDAIVVLTVLFGLLMGSFANVVIYRLPRGESIVHPRSRCISCQKELGWLENVPILSWLIQKGRCRGCGVRISVRYPLVEFVVAVVFGYSLWLIGRGWGLPYVLVGDFIAVVGAAIDLEIRRIPNPILIAGFVSVLILLACEVVVNRRFDFVDRSLISLLACSGVFYLIAVLSRGGMGMGDVKFVGLLGAIVGIMGFKYVFVMVLSSFALGSIFGIALIAMKKAGRKSAVPFGPFIGAGYLVSQLSYHFTPHLFGL